MPIVFRQATLIFSAMILVLTSLVACVANKVEKEDLSLRVPAATVVLPRLIYITYDKDGRIHLEQIAADRWSGMNGGFSEGGREDYLSKIYSANTRGISLRNIRHAACFMGWAQDIEKMFFSPANSQTSIRNIVPGTLKTKASQDGKMLGIAFTHASRGSFSFRMTSCDYGKSGYSDVVARIAAASVKPSETALPFMKPEREIASANSMGFDIEDRPQGMTPNLPFFELRADYEKAPPLGSDRPWRGMNLKDEKERLRFALMLQAHFYEYMANQNPNPDKNFIAQQNRQRYWCHMPWMQVGNSGREGVHGLTKELDLRPSAQIPTYSKATPGSDWGVAYFNTAGCRTIGKVFGSKSRPLPEPNFKNVNFEDGTISTKMLFTTANFPEIKDAYSWVANVSEPGTTNRMLKSVRHIQMDISVKDSTLKGANPLLDHWLMLGYYYDPTYDYDREYKAFLGQENPLKRIPNLPAALLKMRPMGVQTGFDGPETGDTVLFKGAYTNGAGGRLNGPADNPKSSCLGCHGAAGTGVSMVPGFLTLNIFEPHRLLPRLEFNQQLALARNNYETRTEKGK